jgi:hypothetical protein
VPGDQGHDERVEGDDLAVQELGAAAQLTQRDPGVVADDRAGPGPQGRQVGDQVSGGVRGEPGAQVFGPVTISARAWLMAWVRSDRALRLATISARTASTAPSRPFGAPRALPDCAARAALTASSGSDLRRRSCRSERSTSTTRTPAADMWRARPAP